MRRQPLSLRKQRLDFVPKLVAFAVVVPFDFPVRLRRRDRHHPQGLNEAADLVSFVGARSIARGAFATGLSHLSSRARPSGASWACPSDRRKTIARRSLAETMSVFVFHPLRDLPMHCGQFFFCASVPCPRIQSAISAKPSPL